MALTRRLLVLFALTVLPVRFAPAGQDPPGADARTPTAKELYYQLDATIQRLRRVRVLMADRSVTHKNPSSASEVLVRWHELYLCDDKAQLRSDWIKKDRSDWWEPATSSHGPLSGETVSDYPGLKYCYRPEGDPTHVEILNAAKERHLPYSIWFGASLAPRPLGSFFAPFLKQNRAWERPDLNLNGGLLLVDQLARSDYQRWDVTGRERVANKSMIKVVVPVSDGPFAPKLQRHDGKLEMSSVWYVWFTDDEHHFPARIESDHLYVYNGRAIPMNYPSDGRHGPVYSIEGYKDFGNGLWYPESGKEIMYTGLSDTGPVPSPDAIVQEFLDQGRYSPSYRYTPLLTREWKVLEIEDLDPEIVLWIEAPQGAMVNRLDTGVEQIVGKTVEETSKLLGYMRTGANTIPSSSWRPARLLLVLANAAVLFILFVAFVRRRRLNA